MMAISFSEFVTLSGIDKMYLAVETLSCVTWEYSLGSSGLMPALWLFEAYLFFEPTHFAQVAEGVMMYVAHVVKRQLKFLMLLMTGSSSFNRYCHFLI